MKAISQGNVFLLFASFFFATTFIILQSQSLIDSVASSDVLGGLGVEGGCDSCGKECFKVCGLRSFRACCFNYIKKKRNGGVAPGFFGEYLLDEGASSAGGAASYPEDKKFHDYNKIITLNRLMEPHQKS